MPRPRNPVPAYRLHKPSGQAVVKLTRPDGSRRSVYLGPYNSPESKAEYRRLLATLQASPAAALAAAARADAPGRADPSVNEVLLAFLTYAAAYYRRADGTPTSELKNYRDAVRPVKALFGHVPAGEFGPLALKAVRHRMVGDGLCRPVVNKAVGRVKRVFKWAAAEELIPFDVYHRLTAVAGLGKGRTAAREPDPVKPVDAVTVAATLPLLNRHVAAMVRVQMLTGMRPGEVCRMTSADLDRSGPVWVYAPPQHKTAHRGAARRVMVGPQAQAVLLPFLAGDPAAPLFSPRQARAERYAAMRAARRSKVTPSQVCRKKASPDPRKTPAAAYTPGSYAHAVGDGVAKANARRERLAGPGGCDPVPHWHPNQLRHAHATAVRKRYGLEAAGATLGHAKLSVTEVYAERDLALAEKVAAELG